MKFFVAVAFVAIMAVAYATPVQLTEEQKTIAKGYVEECKKQEKITDEEAMKLKNRDFTSEPSQNMKCFANCFYEKTGTLKDGVVQEAVVLDKLGKLIGEEKTKEIMAKCNNLKGDNNCETAYKLFECYEKEKPAELKI